MGAGGSIRNYFFVSSPHDWGGCKKEGGGGGGYQGSELWVCVPFVDLEPHRLPACGLLLIAAICECRNVGTYAEQMNRR
jgi:hypothetical protein